MLLKRQADIRSSEITDEKLYVRRREFMRLAGSAAVVAAAGPLIASCRGDAMSAGTLADPLETGQTPLPSVKPKVVTTDEKQNSFEAITRYNNFYEFGIDKEDPQR